MGEKVKLLPCPFSGEPAYIHKVSMVETYTAQCGLDGCPCKVLWWLTEKEAIVAWNRRRRTSVASDRRRKS